MKKVFLLILFSFIFFTSCERVWYEDLVPSESEYASWDGNYFYYGNYRSKSTGMDEEQLVSEVVIDEKKYKVLFLKLGFLFGLIILIVLL